MLTDIFARRYDGVPIRRDFTELDQALMVQMFSILAEDVAPYDGVPEQEVHEFWATLERKLAREFGISSLSNKLNMVGQLLPPVAVCHAWMFAKFGKWETADGYVKMRLSLIELGFRQREEGLAEKRPKLLASIDASTVRLSGPNAASDAAKITSMMQADAVRNSSGFRSAVEELNARLRQAGYPLHYHNGFLQFSQDREIEKNVEAPFWPLVAGPKWSNVDHDMKEAVDLRDTGGRDPAWYAARALESTIKIISDEKGWTHGGEKGAHNFIDNLVS